MKSKRECGFTLVEVLIVVVIMAVLAATIIPQFTDSTKDAKTSSVQFNVHTLRSQIQLYKAQHDALLPSATLTELINSTDTAGNTGSGASYPLGPYMQSIPENPFTNSNSVASITNSPAILTDVTGSGGWLYNATTGEIWVDHADYFTE